MWALSAYAQTGKPYSLPQKPQDQRIIEAPDNRNVTARDLMKSCNNYFVPHFYNRERMARKSVCSSYFYGALSAILWLQYKQALAKPHCIPPTLSAENAIRVFLDWGAKTDRLEEFIAIEGVFAALDDRYACRSQ